MNTKITVLKEIGRVISNSTLVDTCLRVHAEFDHGTIVLSIPSVEYGIVIVTYDGLVSIRFGEEGNYVSGMNRTIWDINSFDQLIEGMIEHEEALRIDQA